MNNYKEHLADWIFRWNSYRLQWEATEREHYNELFSGDKGHVLRAKLISDLIEVINRKIYKNDSKGIN